MIRIKRLLLSNFLIFALMKFDYNVISHPIINIWCKERKYDAKCAESDSGIENSPIGMHGFKLVGRDSDCLYGSSESLDLGERRSANLDSC